MKLLIILAMALWAPEAALAADAPMSMARAKEILACWRDVRAALPSKVTGRRPDGTAMTVPEIKVAQDEAKRARIERLGACLNRDEASAIGTMSGTVAHVGLCRNIKVSTIVAELENGVRGQRYEMTERGDNPYAEGDGKFEEPFRWAHNIARKKLPDIGLHYVNGLEDRPDMIASCNSIEDDYGPKGRVWADVVAPKR